MPFDSHENSPLYFDTYERPMFYKGRNGTEYPVPNKKAIVRMVDNEPTVLGVVGNNYSVVPNKELFEAVEAAMRQQFDHTDIMQCETRDRQAYDGAYSAREYNFKTVAYEIDEKSQVGFRALIWNTFDGSSAIRLATGAINWFCFNGIISGDYDLLRKRHTSGFTASNFAGMFERQVELWRGDIGKYRRYAQIELQTSTVINFLDSLVEANLTSDRHARIIRQRYLDFERVDHGNNVWALHNAFTYHATHDEYRDTGTDHAARTQLNRQLAVRKIENSKPWKELVYA